MRRRIIDEIQKREFLKSRILLRPERVEGLRKGKKLIEK
jgi:hypothetical protein